MGGNESSSSQPVPYDLLYGQNASFSGGTPSGFNYDNLYSGIGSGLQSAGRSIAGSQTPIPQFQSPDLPGGSASSAPFQPTTIQYDPNLNDALDRILQLFGGGY